MKFLCLVTLGFFVSVQSASIFLKPIDIPVKVIYDDEIYNTHQTVSFKNIAGSRNLNEKIQLSTTDLRQLSELDENDYQGNSNSIKNLDAKVQLSLEELRVAEKHLPFENIKENVVEFMSNSVKENSNTDTVQNQNSGDETLEENEKPAENINLLESGKPNETIFGILGEVPLTETTPAPLVITSPVTTTEENLPDPNVVLLIQIAQNIVASGLENIRENIDNLSTNPDGNKNPPITSEQWSRLNQTIQDFFAVLLERGTRQVSMENMLQDILTGVRGVTDNFLKSLHVQSTEFFKNANPQAPSSEENIINLVTAGFQQITNNIGNIPNQNKTKNNENATTTASARPLQEIINGAQQIFGDQSTSSSSHVLPIQSDTPSTPERPFEVFQNVANQVSQAINNLNPFTASPAPGSQGDEGSTPANPLQSIQNAANQVGQAINSLNPFNRPSSAAPGSQGDDVTTTNPLQSFQNAANQVGQAINSLNPFNRPSSAAPGSQGDDPTTINPLQSFQNAANQVGQAINSLNPFNRPSSAAPGSQGDAPTTTNPFESFQNAANQVGQAINNLNPFKPSSASVPGSQNEEATTPLPIQQAFQNVANQLGAAINNLNPFNSPSTPATNLQSDSTTQNKPLQGVQNVISQVGQAISTLNPLNQVPTEIPINNPSQGVQNAINQVGQAISSLNPLNQGSSTPSSPISGSLQTIQAIGNQGQQLLGGQSSVKPVESIQTVIDAVNKPSEAITGTVETIQSIGTQIIPEKKPVPKEKAEDFLPEQEIMVAVD